MSLRVADITDLDIAKQVAHLALAEVDRLYARLEVLTKQLAALQGTQAPEQLELELLRIREQMMAMQRRAFAASSEKRSREVETDDSKSKPSPPDGVREQRKLRLDECVHELVADARCCANCGREMEEWNGQHEEFEEVDVVQRQYVLRKHLRKKYRCRCGASPKLAPGPLRLPGGGRHSLDFAIEVAVNKWCLHLPLERQVRMMRSEGLDVDSSTLWEQTERLARVLAPTSQAIRQYVVEADVVHGDVPPRSSIRPLPATVIATLRRPGSPRQRWLAGRARRNGGCRCPRTRCVRGLAIQLSTLCRVSTPEIRTSPSALPAHPSS